MLALALDQVLRLFHPFVPVHHRGALGAADAQCPVRGITSPQSAPKLIITAPWPQPQTRWEDEPVEAEFALVRAVVRSIRDLRARSNVPPRKQVDALLKADGASRETLERASGLIRALAALSSLEIGAAVSRPAAAATTVTGDVEIYVTGLIDPAKERGRLEQQRDKLTKDAAAVRGRLGNPKFVEKAPPAVVAAEKAKLDELTAQVELLERTLGALPS